MIQKVLYFIWIGNHFPSYASCAINAFQQMNPSFEIHLASFNLQDLYRIETGDAYNDDESLLRKSIQSILCNDSKYSSLINHCKRNNLRFIQILADVYRLELLQHYGGIYLDCDTFPVKPFDENLLQRTQVIVQRHFNDQSVVNDNYFIGYDKNSQIPLVVDIFDECKTKDVYKCLATPIGWWKNVNFLRNKKKFFECKLNIGEYSFSRDFYIDHYNALTWKDVGKGLKIQKCKFDDMI